MLRLVFACCDNSRKRLHNCTSSKHLILVTHIFDYTRWLRSTNRHASGGFRNCFQFLFGKHIEHDLIQYNGLSWATICIVYALYCFSNALFKCILATTTPTAEIITNVDSERNSKTKLEVLYISNLLSLIFLIV